MLSLAPLFACLLSLLLRASMRDRAPTLPPTEHNKPRLKNSALAREAIEGAVQGPTNKSNCSLALRLHQHVLAPRSGHPNSAVSK